MNLRTFCETLKNWFSFELHLESITAMHIYFFPLMSSSLYPGLCIGDDKFLTFRS